MKTAHNIGKQSFILFAPNYTHTSAGIRALFMLAEYLIDLGHEVSHANYQAPQWPSPPWCRMTIKREFPKTVIGIMPETCEIEVRDIPVIRWALNHPGHLGGPKTYAENEFVIHYDGCEETAKAAAHNGVSHELTLGTIDIPAEFATKERVFDLWYEGKCRGDGSHPADALRLTRSWPPTREELWSIFARTSTLWNYDDFTAINLEAWMAGARVKTRHNGEWRDYSPPPNHERFLINPDRDRARIAEILDIFSRRGQ